MNRLPAALGLSVALPALAFALAWYFPEPAPGESLEHYLQTAKIVSFAIALTAVTAVFTIAIGCVIVWVMKGPAYVADPYPLQDSEEPANPTESGST